MILSDREPRDARGAQDRRQGAVRRAASEQHWRCIRVSRFRSISSRALVCSPHTRRRCVVLDARGNAGDVVGWRRRVGQYHHVRGQPGSSSRTAKGAPTDGTFASNSDNKIPDEKAVKTYAVGLKRHRTIAVGYTHAAGQRRHEIPPARSRRTRRAETISMSQTAGRSRSRRQRRIARSSSASRTMAALAPSPLPG